VIAIIVGIVGLSDVGQLLRFGAGGKDGHVQAGGPGNPLLRNLPPFVPLLLFGIATGTAWTAIQRATFRIALIEGSRVMQNRVHQSDIPYIIKVKLPTISWLSWRVRPWRTTAFYFKRLYLLRVGIGVPRGILAT
jgi:hypothetical protein